MKQEALIAWTSLYIGVGMMALICAVLAVVVTADDWRTDERGILTWSKRDVEDWLGQPIEVIGAAAARPKQERSFQRPPARAVM